MNALSGLGAMSLVAAVWAYVGDILYQLDRKRRRRAADW